MKKLFHQILLVEDDTVTNFINESLLEGMQITDEIHAYKDGAQALEFIKKHWLSSDAPSSEQFNKLLLLDIHLEDLNGFELLEKLGKMPPIKNICIVILSNSHHQRDIEKAEKFKIDAFLEKPLTRDKLEAVYNKLQECAEEQ